MIAFENLKSQNNYEDKLYEYGPEGYRPRVLYIIQPPKYMFLYQNISGTGHYLGLRHFKAKQPESGDLCGNIEFGVAERSPDPTG